MLVYQSLARINGLLVCEETLKNLMDMLECLVGDFLVVLLTSLNMSASKNLSGWSESLTLRPLVEMTVTNECKAVGSTCLPDVWWFKVKRSYYKKPDTVNSDVNYSKLYPNTRPAWCIYVDLPPKLPRFECK